MNLIIDQGNTVSKIALYESDKEVYATETANCLHECLCSIVTKYAVSKAIYSSVISNVQQEIDFLKEIIPFFIFLNDKTALPIDVLYKTPETLGRDRLAAVIGANWLQPERNCLVIDAGTAVTYDFIDSKKKYHGGNIAPGLHMRFNALHHYTAKLPLIDKNGDLPDLGNTTETAIRAGVVWGLCYEIDAYIDFLRNKHKDLFVFLTGGDAFFLSEKLKNSIFADSKLVIKGLNRILNYNADL